jgi:tight adherence protein C
MAPFVAISAALTVSFSLIFFLARRDDLFRERLRSMTTWDPDDDRPNFSIPFLERVLYPLTESLSDRIISWLPAGVADRLNSLLIVAGEPIKFRSLMLLWVAVIAFFGLGGSFLIISSGGLSGPLGLIAIAGLLAISAVLPYSYINTMAKRRKKLIFKALPDGMDLITTSVEAGLGLDAAIAKVAEKRNNALAVELARALREMALGRARREALQDMAERTQVPELQTFVGSLVQAEQLGVSLAQVLRVQADQLRVRRRQKAQEQAMQAPVKMVFPLVFGIFPTLLMVILGPAVITFVQNGGLSG